MNKEKLDALLQSGAITQDEYNEMLEKIGGAEPTPEPKPEDDEGKEKKGLDDDELDRIIQAKVDKITAQLGKEKAGLQKELDKLKKEKLTDEERAELERKEKEDELERREKALLDKENRLYAIKAIKSAGLDDGSDKSLELVEFVMANDEAEIDKKIKAFGDLVKKFVKSEVDKTFKQGGREPNKGGGTPSADNPYSKETYNLTKQMELEANNPELAKQLKALAK